MEKKLRELIPNLEVKGEWETAELLRDASDYIIRIDAQNSAYRHALSVGVTVNIDSKTKRLFK